MPSLLAEARDQSSLRPGSSNTQESRTSMDKSYHRSSEASGRHSNGDLSVKSAANPNGRIQMQTLPNGYTQDSRKSSQDKAAAYRDSDASATYKRESMTENEKPLSNGDTAVPRHTGRDDGRFSYSEQGNAEERRFRSTKVTIDMANGVDGTQESSFSESPTTMRASMDHGSPSQRASSTYPPADPTLLNPNNSSQRVSSPSSFPPVQQSTNPLSSQLPPGARLQHRHTLEVPKVSTSRMSREFAGVNSEDIASATGRFSPNTPTRRRGSMSIGRRGTRSIQSDGHLEELHDEDAARWAEHVRLKRISKRKRKEEEDDDRVVVGTKVEQGHVNYVTAYNMLTGIRFTVSRTNAKMNRELEPKDFEDSFKFQFDVNGNELTPSAKYDFKFKDYAPWVFRHLRIIFQQDPADYLMSLTSKYILSELGSPGKSGSFFYFSRDYKYIIKTIHHGEHKFLRKILVEYYDHVRHNPNTLLSQFYGLHRVKLPYGRKIHFVVMNNLFPPHRDIHHTFDLKGSTIGRDFREEELEKNPRATLKDLNWLRRDLHLEFGPTKKMAFIKQMEADVKLLQRLRIMDYSLLVGIHDLEKGNEEGLREKNLQVFQPMGDEPEDFQANPLLRTPSKLENARKAKELRATLKLQKPVPMSQTNTKMPDEAVDGKTNFYFYSDDGGFRATHEDDRPGEEIYYLGIIDCLTKYNSIKRMEHFIKGLSSQESQISAIPPERYGDRFVRFISGVTKTKEAAEAEKLLEQERREIDLPGTSIEEVRQTPTEKVMEKAEKVAERSKRHGRSEEDIPERSITVVRSPSAERGELGYSLPVVEEAQETSSVDGRSARSQRSTRSFEPNIHLAPAVPASSLSPATANVHSRPPPTPPKDGRELDDPRPPTPPKDGPPTPPKDSTRGRSRDKQLPTIPHTNSGDLAPPLVAQEFTHSPSQVKAGPGGVEMEEYGMRIDTVQS